MYSKLISWSRYAYLAGIVLALVLVIPATWFPFQLAKVSAFAVFLLIAAVLFVLGGGMREVVRTHGFYGALLVALLPVAYVISMFFSIDKSVAMTGFSIETDTVVFATLAFLAFMLSFTLFRTLRNVRLLLTVLSCALVVAAVFQCVSIVFGSAAIPFSTFADRSVNLVGKWNDLGLLTGLLVMLLLVRVELMSVSNLWRIVTGVVCAFLVVLLGIINFPMVWGLLLVFSLVLAVVKFLMHRGGESEEATRSAFVRKLPWFSLVLAILSVLFLFFGSAFNTGLTALFPVSSLEVRPSYSSTLNIINTARQGSFGRVLVGTGPNTFGQEWLLHRPSEVNQSAFWSLDFNVGFSSFVTALGTVGLLGLLGWLVPILLVLGALVRALRLNVLNREDKIVATSLGIATLFTLASILLYVPSQNIILLGFVLAGVTFGFLWRQGQPSIEATETLPSRMGQLSMVAAMLVLLVLALTTATTTSRRFLAEAYIGHGTEALSNGNADTALANAARAQGIEKTGDGYRLLVSANAAKLQQIATSPDASKPEVQQQFAALFQAAVVAGQAASALNPADYRSDLALAQIYDYLSTLKVQGAAQTALNTYQSSEAKDPTNPAIPLAIARLAAAQGSAQITTTFLSQALTLKPNYTDAILLVVQLDIAQNDIPSAIKAAAAAAQTAPGVAPIWFQLGLLYYAAGDAKDAATALQQAVAIQSDYANAKYFLGLSYFILGRHDDATKQFQDLLQSNPDNAEVKLILSNLAAGKQPFDGAQPPVTPKPQTRATAPVSE